jgi:hypothetical protein
VEQASQYESGSFDEKIISLSCLTQMEDVLFTKSKFLTVKINMVRFLLIMNLVLFQFKAALFL